MTTTILFAVLALLGFLALLVAHMSDATAQVQQFTGSDEIVELGVTSGGTVVPGTMVAIQSDGYIDDAGDDAGVTFAGIVESGHPDEDEDTGLIDNTSGADGAKKARVRVRGRARMLASGTADATWIGQRVYVVDNQTVALLATVTNAIPAGICVKVVSATEVEFIILGPSSPIAGAASGSTYTQTYSTADRTVAAPTAVAVTDSGTGTDGDAIAAGVGICQIAFDLDLAAGPMAGTSAADLVTDFVPGFKFKLLALDFVTSVAGVGSGASQVAHLEIGATPVTNGTCTITEASTSAVGAMTAGAAITGANTGSASDTISVLIAASGTAFSAGHGTLIVTLQNMDTADAFAALAGEIVKLIADDLDNRKTITALIDDLQTVSVVG